MADFYMVDPIAVPQGTVIRIMLSEVVDWGRRDKSREHPTTLPRQSTFRRSNGPTGAGFPANRDFS